MFDFSFLKGSSSPAADLREFIIELENPDAYYTPGSIVSGYVVLVPKEEVEIDVLNIKLHFYGAARLNCKLRGLDSQQEVAYLDDEFELELEEVSAQQRKDAPSSGAAGGGRRWRMAVAKVRGSREHVFKFEHQHDGDSIKRTLKNELRTSMLSRNASILYTLRACCTYKRAEGGATKRVHAVRGLSIVEIVDLNRMPSNQFEEVPNSIVKKFGLFSCTGGQIRLSFSLSRSAFVCGENIIITGRVENKTDRRIDRIAAVLQQIVAVGTGDADLVSEGEVNLDVTDVHEDDLALFVDDGATLKLDRNFAIPSLPPSTLIVDDSKPEAVDMEAIAYTAPSTTVTRPHRFSLVPARLSIVGRAGRSNSGSSYTGRLVKILYRLSVRVKTGGTEVMEVSTPIVIGTVPRDSVLNAMLRQIEDALAATIAASRAEGGIPINDPSRLLDPRWTLPMDADDYSYSSSKAPQPQQDPQQQLKSLAPMKSILYLQCKRERFTSLTLPNEDYLCPRSHLIHVNKYPFFVDLPSSSKQSKKVSMLARMSVVGETRYERITSRQQQKQVEDEMETEGQQVAEGQAAETNVAEQLGSQAAAQPAVPQCAVVEDDQVTTSPSLIEEVQTTQSVVVAELRPHQQANNFIGCRQQESGNLALLYSPSSEHYKSLQNINRDQSTPLGESISPALPAALAMMSGGTTTAVGTSRASQQQQEMPPNNNQNHLQTSSHPGSRCGLPSVEILTITERGCFEQRSYPSAGMMTEPSVPRARAVSAHGAASASFQRTIAHASSYSTMFSGPGEGGYQAPPRSARAPIYDPTRRIDNDSGIGDSY